MDALRNLTVVWLMLAIYPAFSQFRNNATKEVSIAGNCEICKKTIELAGNVRNTARVSWDADTKIAVLSYDAAKTNSLEILKRIALAGYDNDEFLAPDDAYDRLAECCRYPRSHQKQAAHATHPEPSKDPHPEEKREASGISEVYESYFTLKDALVNTDEKAAAKAADRLNKAILKVKTEQSADALHSVWTKLKENLVSGSQRMAAAQNIGQQREYFIPLSKDLYELTRVAKPSGILYYQHCPMADGGKGANWLSRENAVKNPYYGDRMLTCGKTVETIQ